MFEKLKKYFCVHNFWIKKNDTFICEHCGIKYSSEEVLIELQFDDNIKYIKPNKVIKV